LKAALALRAGRTGWSLNAWRTLLAALIEDGCSGSHREAAAQREQQHGYGEH
jgi:hypothetical protein